MNAINFLINEHDKVRKTLAEIDEGSHNDETKRKMFETLCEDLIRHEVMEHKIWYPYFKDHDKLEDTVKHLLTEEKGAEKAIRAFDKVNSQKEWEEKFAKFKKDVEHHAEEEEQKLFPNVKKILDEATLEKIGKEMHAFKQQYSA